MLSLWHVSCLQICVMTSTGITEKPVSMGNQISKLTEKLKQIPREELLASPGLWIRIGSFYILNYEDSKGNRSKRLVKAYGVSNNWKGIGSGGSYYGKTSYYGGKNQLYLKTYCYLKEDNRTFRLDRIVSIYKADSLLASGYQAWEVQAALNLNRGATAEAGYAPASKRHPPVQQDTPASEKVSAGKDYLPAQQVTAQQDTLARKRYLPAHRGKFVCKRYIPKMADTVKAVSAYLDESDPDIPNIKEQKRREKAAKRAERRNKIFNFIIGLSAFLLFMNWGYFQELFTGIVELVIDEVTPPYNHSVKPPVDSTNQNQISYEKIEKIIEELEKERQKSLNNNNKKVKPFSLEDIPDIDPETIASYREVVASINKSVGKIQHQENKKNQQNRKGKQKRPRALRVVREIEYRGITIQEVDTEYGKRYLAPELSMENFSLDYMKEEINDYLFREKTGIDDLSVLILYKSADENGDFRLSWDEIQDFQNELYRNYKYKSNPIALRPDQFIEQDGGDCEDWALMTAGLLRYWGYTPYIGTLAYYQRANPGHALCLLYSTTPPPSGMDYLHIRENDPLRTFNSDVKPGYYVPIDYTVVGGYSRVITASGYKWYYDMIYVPEKIYGMVM